MVDLFQEYIGFRSVFDFVSTSVFSVAASAAVQRTPRPVGRARTRRHEARMNRVLAHFSDDALSPGLTVVSAYCEALPVYDDDLTNPSSI